MLALLLTGCATAVPREWPNAVSRANSDPWLVQHAEELTVMRPRVLVFNFCADVPAASVADKVQRLLRGVREGSRYHARTNRSSPAFLQPELVRIVDLTAGPRRADGNSAQIPLRPR